MIHRLAWMSKHHGVDVAHGEGTALVFGQVVDELAQRGTLIRSPSSRGIAEEAPGAYKDVGAVVDAAHRAGLARKVARLEPMVCIKG